VFAKVHRLRVIGALSTEKPPPLSEWMSGILEFSRAVGDGEREVPRRLILRHAMANPQKGVLLELYRPELVDIQNGHLRVRGIEPVVMSSSQTCAMLQEWLVSTR
jgi:hypothetical protein